MTIGIYCILNKINGKRYIGKSKNIEHRFASHKSYLKKDLTDKKAVNRYLFDSVKKYGLENFLFEIVEKFNIVDDNLLKDREIYWMDFYKTCDRAHGYNLRRDSSTATTVHDETRKLLSLVTTGERNPNYNNKWTQEQKSKMSDIKKQQIEDGLYTWMQSPEWRAKLSEHSKTLWKDTEKKERMAEKVAQAKSILRFYQYCKVSGELLRIWDSMGDIIKENPDWYAKAIYGVCSGYKKSYRGFLWKSEEKVLHSL
jgi:group I intron endonuclease